MAMVRVATGEEEGCGIGEELLRMSMVRESAGEDKG